FWLAVMVCMVPFAATAQQAGAEFPARPIRIIVPFSPGGPADMIGRVVAAEMQKSMQQSIVVENHPGAGGTLGAAMVAKAPADGHTLLISNIAETWIAHFFKQLPYVFERDFVPVSKLMATSFVVVASPKLPIDSFASMMRYARENPGKLTYGSAGIGVSSHLAGELLAQLAEVDIRHVAYKGQSQAMSDLLGGHIGFVFASPVTAIPMIKGGQVTAIATTGTERVRLLPDVATINESGVRNYDVDTWFGLSAPRGTPAAIVDRLHREAAKALAQPAVRDNLEKQGTQVVGNSPKEFAGQIAADAAKWTAVIKKAGLATD
ncbi:MAG: Bug family tripartite tricarboxylate transporter substrate binding protein, partial [Lautropia sp.]